jgi:hypothetical protein
MNGRSPVSFLSIFPLSSCPPLVILINYSSPASFLPHIIAPPDLAKFQVFPLFILTPRHKRPEAVAAGRGLRVFLEPMAPCSRLIPLTRLVHRALQLLSLDSIIRWEDSITFADAIPITGWLGRTQLAVVGRERQNALPYVIPFGSVGGQCG